MKHNNWLVGGLLIVAGVLLLAQNFRLFGAAENMVWATIFVGGSADHGVDPAWYDGCMPILLDG